MGIVCMLLGQQEYLWDVREKYEITCLEPLDTGFTQSSKLKSERQQDWKSIFHAEGVIERPRGKKVDPSRKLEDLPND